VVAQVFVHLLRVADRYDPARGAPGAFVFAVAGNVLRDHQRRSRRHRALVHRLAGRDLLSADEIELVEAAIDAARAAPAVEAALAGVSDGDGEVLRLVAAGASPAEAARALGISPGAARGRLFRARRRVRSRLITNEEA
jgi:RNA polymerase sigma-70 factor (ECF subfamily)